MESLLRRALIGTPETGWATLLPELQLALNSTFAKATGCPPHLLMFGAPPTPLIRSLRDRTPRP